MLSGESERSRLAAHSSPLKDVEASVAIPVASRIYMSVCGMSFRIETVPPSMTTYTRIREEHQYNARDKENGYQRTGTYMRHLFKVNQSAHTE
jgi:hypothetical protein